MDSGLENKGEKVNVKCLLPIDFTIDEQPIPTITSPTKGEIELNAILI